MAMPLVHVRTGTVMVARDKSVFFLSLVPIDLQRGIVQVTNAKMIDLVVPKCNFQISSTIRCNAHVIEISMLFCSHLTWIQSDDSHIKGSILQYRRPMYAPRPRPLLIDGNIEPISTSDG